MTLTFALPFPLPGDDALLAAVLRRPGGLASVPRQARALVARAVARLDRAALMQLLDICDPGDGALLQDLWRSKDGGDLGTPDSELAIARFRIGAPVAQHAAQL
jgi:hypothetical protein